MSEITEITTRRPLAGRSPVAPAEMTRLGPRELAALRGALARGMGELELGSPACELMGRLSRQVRAEQGRRSLPPGGPRAAA